MKITRVSATIVGITLGGMAGALLQFKAASAATPTNTQPLPAATPSGAASPSPSPTCPPMTLAIAFTSNVADTVTLDLRVP